MLQEDPLTPTINNFVVDSVVRHWVLVMAYRVGRKGGRGWEGRHQSTLFYTDDSMVESSDRGWLHGDFSILVRMFDLVGLGTNVRKTVEMVFRPCQAVRTKLEVEYDCNMIGAGLSYWKRQQVRVWCS